MHACTHTHTHTHTQNVELLGFPAGSEVKASACIAGDLGSIPESGRSPGEGNGNHSSILAWRILWMEEPGGYSPRGCKESDSTE